jgi:translation initiation factor IF-1
MVAFDRKRPLDTLHEHKLNERDNLCPPSALTARISLPFGEFASQRRCETKSVENCAAGDFRVCARGVKEQITAEVVGEVMQVLAGSNFRVKLPGGRVVTARPCWRLQKFRIPVVAGDRMLRELTPYDLDKARLKYRFDR